jgi:undecaprenyl-diphosphatase
MQGVGYAGHPLVSVAVPIALLHADEFSSAEDSYLGLFINLATVMPLKYVIDRKRPSGDHMRWDASFPSGHTTCIFTQAYVLSYHYPKASVPLFVFATAIGISRIYTQKHYPSDVIGSIALGLFTGFLVTSVID